VIPVNWLIQSIDLEEQSNTLTFIRFSIVNGYHLISWKFFKIKIVDNKIWWVHNVIHKIHIIFHIVLCTHNISVLLVGLILKLSSTK